MRPLKSRLLLFAVALVLSQWMVYAHAVIHPALSLDSSCPICLHAPGIDGGVLASLPPVLPPLVASEPPASTPAGHSAPAHRCPPNIRGPPSLPV